MDILVRDVDVVVVKKLEEMAAKKKVSRAEFLRQIVGATAVLDAVTETEEKYEQLVRGLVQIIAENTKALEMVQDAIREGGHHG